VRSDDGADHTFLFADMAGFTALTEEMGDEEAVTVAEGFFTGAREVFADHGATEVKTIGDALMIECGDAAHAIQLGVRIAGEVGMRHGYPSVRVGMHTGPALQRGNDWFGATVNLAARVSGAAAGGEVLVTDATREAAGAISGIDLVERGRQELRNVGGPVSLYRAVPEESDLRGDQLPIDPVCRMAVDPDHAAGILHHEGQTFHFCSMKCVRAFAESPERYLGR
jgi:class 3 adenylate cyclase/YHS domain-containing protein